MGGLGGSRGGLGGQVWDFYIFFIYVNVLSGDLSKKEKLDIFDETLPLKITISSNVFRKKM